MVMDGGGGSPSIGVPSGFTAISPLQVAASGFPQVRAFSKVAVGGDGDATVSVSDSAGIWGVWSDSQRFTGNHATTPIDVVGNITPPSGSATTIDAPDVTVAANGSLALLWAGASNATITRPSGVTADINSNVGFPSWKTAYQAVDAGSYTPGNWTFSPTIDGRMAQTIIIAPAAAAVSLEQEGARHRRDDGTEATATWKAAQDVNATLIPGQVGRLRVLINATGDPVSKRFKLQYREVGDSTWKDVN